MSNISDLMKEINRIRQSTALSELSQLQMRYSFPSFNEMSAIKQSLGKYNLLRNTGVNDFLSSMSVKSVSESAVMLKSLSPAVMQLQSIIAQVQALSSRWENMPDCFGTECALEDSRIVEVDDELYGQMSGAIDAIIPDENPQKPKVLEKVKHRLTPEQLIALISLLLQLISTVYTVYSDIDSRKNKLGKQEQIAVEQSTNEAPEDIDQTQKSLLIVAQSLADSAERLTEIAEDRGLLSESGDNITSKTGEGNAQEKHIDSQPENENAKPKD